MSNYYWVINTTTYSHMNWSHLRFRVHIIKQQPCNHINNNTGTSGCSYATCAHSKLRPLYQQQRAQCHLDSSGYASPFITYLVSEAYTISSAPQANTSQCQLRDPLCVCFSASEITDWYNLLQEQILNQHQGHNVINIPFIRHHARSAERSYHQPESSSLKQKHTTPT